MSNTETPIRISAGVMFEPSPVKCAHSARVFPLWLWPLATLAMLTLSICANANDSLVDTCYWMSNNYGGGKGFAPGEEHVQMIMNDLVVKHGRIYANSTWDEGEFHLTAYDCETGDIVAKATRWTLACKEPPRTLFHAEGAYGIAVDDQYVYGGGLYKTVEGQRRNTVYYNIVWRCDLDLNNADFEGGEGVGNMLKLSSRDTFMFPKAHGHDDMSKVSGMAVYDGELYVSDPVAKKIHVIRTADMTLLEQRGMAFENPGWMTVDHDGYLWVVDRDAHTVKKLTRGEGTTPGRSTGLEIKDLQVPTDLCVNGEGDLLICDNGIDRQQIRTYSTGGKLIGTFGRPAYGVIGEDTFFGVTGVDVDQRGNLFVATHGVPGNRYVDFFHGRVGRGAELHKQRPDGRRAWSLHSLEFVTVGDLDPASKTDYYTTENWITLGYDQPSVGGTEQKNWALKANTIDPIRFPNELRMQVYAKSARVERVQGHKLLIIGSDFGYQFYGIYRFDGAVAVPVALLAKDFTFRQKMTGEQWPPHAPRGPGLWLDKNGNGDFEPSEFQSLPDKLNGWGYGDMQILPDGTLAFHDLSTIWQVPFSGFDQHGVPQWDLNAALKVKPPEDDIGKLLRVVYVPEEDVALVGFYQTGQDQHRVGKVVGNRVRKYAGWSTLFDNDDATHPGQVWELTGDGLPFSLHAGGHHGRLDKFMPVAMHAVDDQYFFVGYDIHSEPEPGTDPFPSSEFPDIRVYRMKDASFVGLIEPQQEVYHGTHGALDIGQCSFCLEKLDDGRYFIAIEDYCGGKNVYYLWNPQSEPTDITGVRRAPQAQSIRRNIGDKKNLKETYSDIADKLETPAARQYADVRRTGEEDRRH